MNCLILTGFQRSGTTALGEWLAQTPNVSYWGEIFHPEGVEDSPRAASLRLRPCANYFQFRQKLRSREGTGAAPTAGTRAEEWNGYLEMLERLRPGHVHVLSVKYSSWHHLDLAWRNPSEPPFLLSLASDGGIPVLHCLRRNLLALAISESLALATDVWHAPSASDFSEPSPVAIDAEFVLRRMRTCAAESPLFQRWLSPAQATEVRYEDLFAIEGGDSAAAIEAVRQHLPDWRFDQAPPLRKLGRDPKAWVANIDELRERLQASEFAELSDRYL